MCQLILLPIPAHIAVALIHSMGKWSLDKSLRHNLQTRRTWHAPSSVGILNIYNRARSGTGRSKEFEGSRGEAHSALLCTTTKPEHYIAPPRGRMCFQILKRVAEFVRASFLAYLCPKPFEPPELVQHFPRLFPESQLPRRWRSVSLPHECPLSGSASQHPRRRPFLGARTA